MKRRFVAAFALTALTALSTIAEAKTTLSVWYHAGRPAERQVLEDQIARFQKDNPEIEIKAVQLPEGSYNDQISAAALSNSLPDLLDFDGPLLANYVWSGHVRPLNGLLPQEVIDDLLPSLTAQGTYPIDGKLYGVGPSTAVWPCGRTARCWKRRKSASPPARRTPGPWPSSKTP